MKIDNTKNFEPYGLIYMLDYLYNYNSSFGGKRKEGFIKRIGT